MARSDLRGRRFGQLEVLQPAPQASKGEPYARWLTKCACGQHRVVYAANLLSGATRSCGCIPSHRREVPDRRKLVTEAAVEGDAETMAALRQYLATRPVPKTPAEFPPSWMD